MQAKHSQAEFDAAIAIAKDTDWARLAAYIDGEGTVLIQRSGGKKYSPTHVLTLIVANTDLRLMNWLQASFTGNVYFSHSASQHRWSKKVCHSWRVFEERAGVILSHCLPYMIMKREQAEIALAYRDLRRLGSKGRKLTDADIQQRDAFRDKIMVLNSPHKAGEAAE